MEQPVHVHRSLFVLIVVEAMLLVLLLWLFSSSMHGVQLDALLLLLWLMLRAATPYVVVLEIREDGVEEI